MPLITDRPDLTHSRRLSAALVTLALLAVTLVPAGMAAGQESTCGTGEVEALANAEFQMSRLAFSDADAGVGVECDFRLFDENGDDTHTFTTDDTFLGGVAYLRGYGKDADIQKRRDAVAVLETFVDELYFGPIADYPALPQIDLTVGPYKDMVRDSVHFVGNHRYAIFSGLEPGEYVWIWKSNLAGDFDIEVEGRIEIVEANP